MQMLSNNNSMIFLFTQFQHKALYFHYILKKWIACWATACLQIELCCCYTIQLNTIIYTKIYEAPKIMKT